MLTRFLAPAILLLAHTSSGNIAIAASNHTTTASAVESQTYQLVDSALIQPLNTLSGNNSFGKTVSPRLLAIMQYYPAAYCYTFAGPRCPMMIAVPPGTPCTCFFPDGALSGIAR